MPSTRKVTTQQGDAWLSLRAAAELLGQTRHTVLTRVVKGELEGQHIAGRTVISRESVERARASNLTVTASAAGRE